MAIQNQRGGHGRESHLIATYLKYSGTFNGRSHFGSNFLGSIFSKNTQNGYPVNLPKPPPTLGWASKVMGQIKMPIEKLLRDRAHEADSFVREHFLDSHGVVLSWLDKETLRIPTEAFFPEVTEGMIAGEDWHVSGFDRSEVAGYENCGMCTGSYLQSLVYRYHVEGTPAVLALAGQEFKALHHIYKIGCELEEGFFPKIYGTRFSNQTSSDQVLYAVYAMNHYAEIAPPAQRAEIRRMIPEMVRFWMKRNYTYLYYHVENMAWPIMRFPPLLLLAQKYSDDPVFREEYHRLLSDENPQFPEWDQLIDKQQGRRALSDYEESQTAFLVYNMADCLTMDVMNLDLLLKLDPSHVRYTQWRQGVLTMWDQAKLAIAPNGKYYSQILVDRETGEVRRPGGYSEGAPAGTESGWSTMVARGAVMASEHLPERTTEITECVISILRQIGISEMTYLDNPDRLPPRQRFKTRTLSGDSISNWLWAYWQGRFLNLFH